MEGNVKKPRKPRRTHKELTEVLFNAVTQMINNQKFREIGINDLAEFAKIEKNFIYKHYGDIDGLLREYINRNDYWGKAILAAETYDQLTHKEIFSVLLQGLFTSFSENTDFQNIIRWEIASSNEYIKRNCNKREEEATELIKYFEAFYSKNPEKDVQCLFALLSAGIYYLILHKNISTFAGVDFSKKNQESRIINVVNRVTEMFFEADNKYIGIVKRLLERDNSVTDIAAILDIPIDEVLLIKSKI